MKFIFTGLVLSCFLLNSCGSKTSDISQTCSAETDGAEFAGIINGKSLKANGPLSSRVVLVFLKKGSNASVCTGSLLPNNVVLTAAHCATEASKMAAIFSVNTDCSKINAENTRAVSRVIIHPSYRPNEKTISSSQEDIAMFKFKGTLPQGFQSFEVPGESFTPDATENMTMIGYGKTSESDSDENSVLRITSNKGDKLVISAKFGLYGVEQSSTGVCEGDSGGPLILTRNAVPKIIGIASKVSGESDASLCHGVSIYARTDFHADWIRKTYQELTR